MHPDSVTNQPEKLSSELKDTSYVDPILFAEGAYADQAEYEQVIDTFADRINKGLATPRGREAKVLSTTEIDASDTVSQRVSLVQAAVKKLAPAYRILITMRYEMDFNDKDIASELNLSVAAVKMQRAKALKELYKLVKETEEIEAKRSDLNIWQLVQLLAA